MQKRGVDQDSHVALHSLVLADGDQGADIDKIQGVRQCRANSCSSEIPRTCQRYANVWDLEVLSEDEYTGRDQRERSFANRSQTHCAPTGRRWRREPDLGQRVGEVATYHHDLEHLTVAVQVKRYRCGGYLHKGHSLCRCPGRMDQRCGTSHIRTPVGDPLERARVHALHAQPAMAQLSDSRPLGPPSRLGWSPLQCLLRYGETLNDTTTHGVVYRDRERPGVPPVRELE